MKIKHNLAIVAIGFFSSFATSNLFLNYFKKPVFNYNYQKNYIIPVTRVINFQECDGFTRRRFKLQNWQIINGNYSLKYTQVNPLLKNWMSLFLKLLIIGHFGYFQARSSSSFEQNLQLICRKFMLILLKFFLLLVLIILGCVIVSMLLRLASSSIYPSNRWISGTD